MQGKMKAKVASGSNSDMFQIYSFSGGLKNGRMQPLFPACIYYKVSSEIAVQFSALKSDEEMHFILRVIEWISVF
jgi:hypothetical protein